MTGHGARHLAGKAAAVGVIIQPDVVDGNSLGAQLLGEMAHRGKQECHLALVMANIGDLLDHLDHQNHILRPIEISEACQIAAQLVAKDKPDRARHHAAPSRRPAKAASASSRDCFRSTTGRG